LEVQAKEPGEKTKHKIQTLEERLAQVEALAQRPEKHPISHELTLKIATLADHLTDMEKNMKKELSSRISEIIDRLAKVEKSDSGDSHAAAKFAALQKRVDESMKIVADRLAKFENNHNESTAVPQASKDLQADSHSVEDFQRLVRQVLVELDSQTRDMDTQRGKIAEVLKRLNMIETKFKTEKKWWKGS
jgi:DNA repair exonuclease SbcCD ATPase subunit